MQDEDDEATGDMDYIPDTTEHFTFTDAQLQAIQNCISNITLPTWVVFGSPVTGLEKDCDQTRP